MKNNIIYYKSSHSMKEIENSTISLVITSPPYFNIKNYSKDGKQNIIHSKIKENDIGNINSYKEYINKMEPIWNECVRVLKPNGKLCINVPLVPIKKEIMNGEHNRWIFDLKNDIQTSVLKNEGIMLMDLYIWKRTNSTKKLMFGSYPYPTNFYNNNICEFIVVFVKKGKPIIPQEKLPSKITKDEWIKYTSQIWEIPIPNKKDLAFGKHCAIMPEEIPRRLIKMFSFKKDIVLDPFAGSGTTLKIAKELGRNYIGYELYENYSEIIEKKIGL